ncbi:MAG: lysophospholipase [Christensenellales bacterium]
MILLPFPGHSPYPRSLMLWEPEGAPRGLVVISHGMAEHIARYDAPARHLAAAGHLVCGYNHLGHGEEAPVKGYFADENGWDRLIEDLDSVIRFLMARHPGLPLALLGHSMGSFVAREYALRHPERLSALVLSGTGHYPAMLCAFARALAGLHCALGMGQKEAGLIHQLAFAGNNKPFAPAQTPSDWLSRDAAQVQKYQDDPLCGFVFTGRGYYDLFDGLMRLTKLKRLDKLPKELPVLLMSGGEDPVGQQGRGVEKVAGEYRAAGLSRVEVTLYPGCRHELFNETIRERVYEDLARWLASTLPERKESIP